MPMSVAFLMLPRDHSFPGLAGKSKSAGDMRPAVRKAQIFKVDM